MAKGSVKDDRITEDGLTEPRRDITAIEIIWRNPWVRAATYVLVGLALITVLILNDHKYAFALQVAVIGFVLAYILNPIVDLLARLRIGRGFAVLIIYLLLLVLFALGSLLFSQVLTELGRLVGRIPEAIDEITPFIERSVTWFAGFSERLPPFLTERFAQTPGEPGSGVTTEALLDTLAGYLAGAAEGIVNTLQNLVAEGGQGILTGVAGLLSRTLQVILILLVSAYFLYDFPRFTQNFRRYVPLRWRPLYNDITVKLDIAVGGYLRGQLLITIVLGTFIWVGLTIIGVPLATAISFLAAIFNLVPYLGPIIGVIPAVLLGLTVSPLTALLAIVVFFVANQLEGNLLAPLILSRSTNLHPVTVMLAILVGAGIFGLVGALLAVPTVALAKVILEDYLLDRPAYQEPEAVQGTLFESEAPEAAELPAPVERAERTQRE